jgi:lipase
MGAFVATLLAAAEPQRVASLVLVDGGFPLAVPPGVDARDPRPLLGPVFERLTRIFPSRDAYRDYWRQAPAFARPGDWTDEVEAYIQYDLRPVDGGFRPSADPDAVATDQAQQYGSPAHLTALRSLQQPVTLLRAPRGLQDEPPGLYPPDRVTAFRTLVPQLEVVEVPDVNHYTILMTSPGVEQVADAVRTATKES